MHVHRIEITCQAFPERIGTLEQVITSVVDDEANWLGAVNFPCMQMSLVMSIRFIFGDD